MSHLRFRDDEPSSTSIVLGIVAGAVAGFAAGMFVAQRVGGFSGLRSKLRRRGAEDTHEDAIRSRYASADADDEFADIEEDEFESEA